MNSVVLMGRLTRDPEVRYSQGERPNCIARYTLAVDRRYRSQNSDQPTADYISCLAFGKFAEIAEKYFKQGTKITIRGRIQTGSYTNRDGQKSIHNRCRCRRSGICRKQSICGTGSRSCLFSTANRFSSKRNLSPAVNFHKPKWKLPESASRHTTASDRKLPGSTGEWRIHELRKFCKFPELWICTNIQQSNRLHESAASWQQYAAG